MTEKAKPRRLSETIIPGKDYEEKVKISDVLDRDILLMDFAVAEGDKQFARVDPDTGEVVSRDYWNITVEDQGRFLTFSTGAIPIDKVLRALRAKLDSGEVELPLVASFRKEGRTFTIS